MWLTFYTVVVPVEKQPYAGFECLLPDICFLFLFHYHYGMQAAEWKDSKTLAVLKSVTKLHLYQ